MCISITVFLGFIVGSDIYSIYFRFIEHIDEFKIDMFELINPLLGCISISLTQIVIKKLNYLKYELHSNLLYSSIIGIILSVILIYIN